MRREREINVACLGDIDGIGWLPLAHSTKSLGAGAQEGDVTPAAGRGHECSRPAEPEHDLLCESQEIRTREKLPTQLPIQRGIFSA